MRRTIDLIANLLPHSNERARPRGGNKWKVISMNNAGPPSPSLRRLRTEIAVFPCDIQKAKDCPKASERGEKRETLHQNRYRFPVNGQSLFAYSPAGRFETKATFSWLLTYSNEHCHFTKASFYEPSAGKCCLIRQRGSCDIPQASTENTNVSPTTHTPYHFLFHPVPHPVFCCLLFQCNAAVVFTPTDSVMRDFIAGD